MACSQYWVFVQKYSSSLKCKGEPVDLLVAAWAYIATSNWSIENDHVPVLGKHYDRQIIKTQTYPP